LAALLVDERRLTYNVVSNYLKESEHLIPLIVFPDEILHLEKKLNGIDREKFQAAVEVKIGRQIKNFSIS